MEKLKSRSADDPDLVTFVRECLLDLPSSGIPKMSMPLFQTAQAKTVDDILKHKVPVYELQD